MARAVAASTLLLLLVPAILFAQEDDLRAQIRADIMQDPRSQEMTQEEQDMLVEALAQEAEETGAADDYIEARSSFDPSSLFETPAESSKFMQVLLSPLMFATVLLIIVVGAVMYFILHRGKRKIVSDLE